MRALCGAIIAAGAMIGLGLTAVGIGTRYQTFPYHDAAGARQYIPLKDLDTSLYLILVVSVATLLVGLATAFVGLAYHHHRRLHEMRHGLHTATGTTTRALP